MINPETDPWEHLDAVRAADLAVFHWEAKKKFETDKSSKNAEEVVALQGIREDHKKTTGWVAEHQGDEGWRFTYMDPATRLTGGTPVTITPQEKTK